MSIEHVMKHKVLYLVFSAVILIPGIVSLVLFGLRLSIDFTGGSLFKYEFATKPVQEDVRKVFEDAGVNVETINFSTGEAKSNVVIRAKAVEPSQNDAIKQAVTAKFPEAQQLSFETVGPAIGAEATRNAIKALGWASVGILIYIAYAFRNIPKPYSSFRFGISAIVSMLHDAFMVLGIFSILGKVAGIEVDSLFITAVLTVIGFSVHDTIVVFDRIRENLNRLPKSYSFENVVDFSVVETLNRSLATSLTVVMTLFALYILGGESIKIFVLAMLIGIVSGTYSSIFTAAPVLVLWENKILRKRN